MPTLYLLDTNILSAFVKEPLGPIEKRIASVGEHSVCTSIIVACELRFGAAKSRSPRLVKNIDAVLASIDIRDFRLGADQHYGAIRAALEGKGQPIGANDLLIAAHALSERMTLVTDNVREFRRVAGLRVENWLLPSTPPDGET